MLEMPPFEVASEANILRAWLRDAGVDSFVQETPHRWLEPVGDVVTSAIAKETRRPPPHLDWPTTIGALQDWLATSPDVPCGGSITQRIAPAGDVNAELMLLIDMPSAGDLPGGSLISGDAGALLDKMLAALKRDRTQIYFASMIPARVPGGVIPAGDIERVAALARHHVSLIKPKKLWLLGRAASRALLGMDELAARGCLHEINHGDVITSIMASVHPQVLLQTPQLKTHVWADMQKLIKD